MLFKKKPKGKTPCEINLDYYMHRDSLTGLFDKAAAVRMYEKVKSSAEYEVVAVRLAGCADMPSCKADILLKEAGALLPRICNEEIFRVEQGDFIVFSKMAQTQTDRLEFFFNQLSDGEERYLVARDKLDKNESFAIFYRRIKRHLGAVDITEVLKCGNLVKNT
ncbi:MAG: hypothetical protein IJZ20_03340 [Clostridia bacterium]|nr:hypothetical protein [Clostridia bacterium]MBQ8758706.1 hypothetical protein [Clostridia bacterium]